VAVLARRRADSAAVDSTIVRHNARVATTGDELLEELRRQRRAGDSRLTETDKEILRRISTGDLAGELADALAAISDADPLLGGGPASDNVSPNG
jgi:hypothetical protein